MSSSETKITAALQGLLLSGEMANLARVFPYDGFCSISCLVLPCIWTYQTRSLSKY